jgi:hypothetical protein
MTTIKLQPRDPEAAYRRAAKAQRKVGVGARCACGETRPLALIPGSAPIICAKCKRKNKGASVMDNHHPFGVSNDAHTTVPFPVNDHQAELNEAQQDWPKQTLKNPDGSPLLKAAGCIRGFIDTILQLIKSGLLWIADMLEKADAFLSDEFGPKYWIGTPLEPFAPKR